MKKILTVLLSLLLCAAMLLPVFADGTVSYLGQAERFIFEPGSKHSPTDLFDGFKNVMPGDVLTQKVFIKNEVRNKVKIKVYMRSLGAHEDSVDFLSQMKLTVSQDGTSPLFAAPADQTAGLTDWTYLGMIYSGGKISLDVKLEVPAEMGNEFQDAVGKLDWEFRIEEYPVDEDDPKPPQTGDNVLTIVIISLAVAGVIFLLLFFTRKRKKDDDDED